MTEKDKLELMRRFEPFGREIPKDQVMSVIARVPTTDRPKGKWIPVSERLPEENEPVLVGIRYKDDFKMVVTARMDVTYWQGLGRDIKGEMRWMPLPEPYKGGEDE